MKMDKSVKYLLIALAIIAGVVLVIVVIKYFFDQSSSTQPPVQPGGPPPETSDSIIDTLGNLASDFLGNLFGGKKCDPDNPGFQKEWSL